MAAEHPATRSRTAPLADADANDLPEPEPEQPALQAGEEPVIAEYSAGQSTGAPIITITETDTTERPPRLNQTEPDSASDGEAERQWAAATPRAFSGADGARAAAGAAALLSWRAEHASSGHARDIAPPPPFPPSHLIQKS
jgi:hypothetical protein